MCDFSRVLVSMMAFVFELIRISRLHACHNPAYCTCNNASNIRARHRLCAFRLVMLKMHFCKSEATRVALIKP